MISRSLMLRFASALVLIPVVLGLLWLGGVPFALLLAFGFVISVWEWRGLFTRHAGWAKVIFIALGVGVFALVTASLWGLRHDFDKGFKMIALVMGAIWASDIMAYMIGKYIGGPKLCPSISPNKTWAGLFGACLGPVMLFLLTLPTPWFYALSGVLFGLAGQAGDLSISLLKRRAGLKDTGALIPGHGGLLDRIDSFIFAIPLAYALMHLVGHN